jgi:hypothetical protein
MTVHDKAESRDTRPDSYAPNREPVWQLPGIELATNGL